MPATSHAAPVSVAMQLDEPLELLLESVVVAAKSAHGPRREELASSLAHALGSFAVEPVWVDVRRMLETVIDAAGSGALLSTRVVTIASDEPVYAYGDYAHLALALLHLLENAIVAANRVVVGEVWIRVQRSSAGGAYVEIADNGEGMDRDTLRQVFSPFFTTHAEAAGLGLPLARAMIESLGGNLELQSEPSIGTIAMLQLPSRDPSLVG